MSQNPTPRLPRWAALADALAVALAALAIVVIATGGFRGRVAGILISIRSADRLLILAAIVAAARHLAVRRPTLIARLLSGARRLPGAAQKRLHGLRSSTSAGQRTRPVELLLVAGLMTVLTAVMTYPQIQHLDGIPDHADPLFSMWRMAWVAHQLPTDPLHLYDANIFWPSKSTLAHSDGMPLVGAAAAPLIWAGVRLPVVYNLALFASFVLAGVATYGFARSLVNEPLAALIAAVAFAFYPFRFEHYVHLELLMAFWMPVALWALHRMIQDGGGVRAGVLLGAAVAAQFLSSMYFGIFLAYFVLVVGATQALARGRLAALAKPALAAALVGGVLIAPVLPPYLHVRQEAGDRSADEVGSFSAQPADYLAVNQPNRQGGEVNERQVYPGLTVLLLALIALLPPWSAIRWAYVAGLVVMFDISLGSNGILQPFLYEWVLPFRGLRALARASMLVGLSLVTLAAFGASRAMGVLRHPALKAAFAAGVCVVLMVSSRPALALKPVPAIHPIYEFFAGRPPTVMVDMPMWYPVGGRYIVNSTAHWPRLVHGFSGSVPDSYRPFHRAIQSFPSEESLSLLRARGVEYVVVHEEFYGEHYAGMIQRIGQEPSLALVTRATNGEFEASLYQLGR